MMRDEEKTKGQLIKELAELRGIIAEFEASKAGPTEKDQKHKQEAAPFKNPQGERIGIVEDIWDITERKKIEENDQKARQLESIGILAGGIAHDFNNLLSVIIGNIGLAKKFVPPGNKALSRLDDAEQICLMASDLSNRLITFATGGDPVLRIVPLSGLIADAVNTMLKGSNINAEIDLPADLHAVAIDEGQMKQVVNNLAINAKEAMPHGGSFTVQRREYLHFTAGQFPAASRKLPEDIVP